MIHGIETWLKEEDPLRLAPLFSMARDLRDRNVGGHTRYRALLEISNFCVKSCTYCGLRAKTTPSPATGCP